MWKKILSLTFFGSFIIVTSSNVISCNVPKHQQLSFNLSDWPTSWAFTTQNVFQGIAKGNRKFLVKESDGLFLHDDGTSEEFGFGLFEKFDHTKDHKSNTDILETYLQLKYFVPSIIYFNEQAFDSKLKKYESIIENFDFDYESRKNMPTKVEKSLEKEKNLPDVSQRGDVCELLLGTESGSTLSAYFDVIISLKTSKETSDGKIQTPSGYYIKDKSGYKNKIKISMGFYFTLSDF